MAAETIAQTGSSFRYEVERSFAFLLDSMGFRVTEEYNDPNLVGNAIIVLQKENVMLRFVRDRADFYCDLSTASVPQRWYALYDVLAWLIRKGMPIESYKLINKLHPVSRLLQKNAKAILAGFSENYEGITSAIKPM